MVWWRNGGDIRQTSCKILVQQKKASALHNGNSCKKGYFCQFLASKFMTKYGIVSTYSVTFVSQKILACLQWYCITWLSLKIIWMISDNNGRSLDFEITDINEEY